MTHHSEEIVILSLLDMVLMEVCQIIDILNLGSN
jgi:hypothetical protein